MTLYSWVLAMLLITFLLSMLMSWSWIIDFSILNLGPMSMSVSALLEQQSSAFVFTVSCIFLMVYLYSFSYLSSEVYLKRFLMILSLFASSMCILILSGNLFSSLIGWDGLGVTSLFLILFYYSKSALKAATLTFLMNRVGDCFFIMALTQIILIGESYVCYSLSSFTQLLMFLLIITSLTKSAQIPFSTWLPAAMEAPTPVSALVHSSTLVTAGIFLLYRYSVIWINSPLSDILLIVSLSTCFMAALSALVESDLKKLIALSTLSQLGFIMFSLSLGLLMQGFNHMLMHAYFKALLFMCSGFVIHSFKGSQSITIMSLSEKQNPLLMTIMSCSITSMMGLPFMSGFYSKDFIVDSLKSMEWSVLIFFLLLASFMCTAAYSVRVIWYLMNSNSNWHSMSDSDLGMIKPMIPLTLIAFTGGSFTFWLLMEVDLVLNSSKVLIIISLGAIVVLYWSLKELKFSDFLESKWNLNIMNSLLSSALFYNIIIYKDSSDLLGVPEILNKKIKSVLMKGSTELTKTMTHYSSSPEFLLFLVGVTFSIMMVWAEEIFNQEDNLLT